MFFVASTVHSRIWRPRSLHSLRPHRAPAPENRRLRPFSISHKMDEAGSGDNRIHILGVGNLGRFFAHALANSTSPPPISLLLHRSSLLEEWEQAGRKISITTNGVVNSEGHFDIEDVSSTDAPLTHIANLVIATKTLHTVAALQSVSQRLDSRSTVLFIQNGMGTIDEVNTQVFRDTSTRPNYLTCITSHGVYDTGPFSSVHAGQAHTSIGRSIQESPPSNPSKAQYLINKVLQAPTLVAREYPSQDLLYLQLEKLVINAMINPLTAIFDCRNGELFSRAPIVELMRVLLQEAAQVIQVLPEISASEHPSVEDRFSTEELEIMVLDIAEKTARNTSSMLQDVRAGRPTEIDYINGWIVRKGGEHGVECEHNATLVEMVKNGETIGIDDIKDHFPGIGDKLDYVDVITRVDWF